MTLSCKRSVHRLMPEITVNAAGVYWHLVRADRDDQLVTRELFLLREPDEVERWFVAHRARVDPAARWFPCA